MAITYNLDNLLKDRKINKTYLRNNGLNPKTVDRLSKNISVTIDTINTLCNLLKCTPNELLIYTPDKPAETKETVNK